MGKMESENKYEEYSALVEDLERESAGADSHIRTENVSIIHHPQMGLDADNLRKSVVLHAHLLPKAVAEEFGAIILNAPYGTAKFRIGVRELISPEDKRRFCLRFGLTTTSPTVIQFRTLNGMLFDILMTDAYDNGNLTRVKKRKEQEQTRNTRFWDGDDGKQKKITLDGVVVDANSADDDVRGKRLDISNLAVYYEVKKQLDAGDIKESDLQTLRFVMWILQDFILSGSSDLHFDSRRGGGRIRYRFQGKLYTRYDNIPGAVYLQIVSSFCILSGREPAKMKETGIASIIKLIITYNGGIKPVEFRYQSQPTHHYPSLVLRGHTNPLTDINKIGFLDHQLGDVQDAISNDRGIVLITGPTGSGKTNTLNCIFQILQILDNMKIIETGTPIEIESPRRIQRTIPEFDNEERNNVERQRCFSDAMRSDPDVLGYTETRNTDEMKKCFRAATSGHLVLTTLHAADVEEAFVTLFGMDIERQIVSKGLLAIVSQTLIRTLCLHCRIVDPESSAMGNNGHTIYRENENGCPECRNGFGGQTVVAEVLRFNDEVRQWINEGYKPSEIVKCAAAKGYLKPMKLVARDKLNAGLTSESEVVNLIELKTEINSDSEIAATPGDPAVYQNNYEIDLPVQDADYIDVD